VLLFQTARTDKRMAFLAQSVLLGVLLSELPRESILSLDIRALFKSRQKLNART
jgi:hypothetical protein